MRPRFAAVLAVALPVLLLLSACEPSVTAPDDNPTHTKTVSSNPDDRTPHVLDGQVYAVLDLGTRVIVGGEFTQVKAYNSATVLARRGIFAYTKATGAIDTTFLPQLDRGGVRGIEVAPGGTRLIIGGTFQRVGGATAVGLARINPSTGAVDTGFQGSTNGWVLTMALRGERLFVGGTFTKVGSTTRYRLALLKASTGAVDPGLNLPVDTTLRGTTSVARLDATRNGSRLVITGNFRRVNGQARDQVAVIDVGSTSTLSTWATTAYRLDACASGYDFYVKDVDISPDDRFFAIVTTGAWRGLTTLCDTVARWELGRTGANQKQTWADWTGGDSLLAVSVTGAAVYAAGHQRWANNENAPSGDQKGPGAVDRPGIAAYDPATGNVLPWTIDRERGLQVGVLQPTAQGLWIGSDSSRLGNEWHPRLGFVPL